MRADLLLGRREELGAAERVLKAEQILSAGVAWASSGAPVDPIAISAQRLRMVELARLI